MMEQGKVLVFEEKQLEMGQIGAPNEANLDTMKQKVREPRNWKRKQLTSKGPFTKRVIAPSGPVSLYSPAKNIPLFKNMATVDLTPVPRQPQQHGGLPTLHSREYLHEEDLLQLGCLLPACNPHMDSPRAVLLRAREHIREMRGELERMQADKLMLQQRLIEKTERARVLTKKQFGQRPAPKSRRDQPQLKQTLIRLVSCEKEAVGADVLPKNQSQRAEQKSGCIFPELTSRDWPMRKLNKPSLPSVS